MRKIFPDIYIYTLLYYGLLSGIITPSFIEVNRNKDFRVFIFILIILGILLTVFELYCKLQKNMFMLFDNDIKFVRLKLKYMTQLFKWLNRMKLWLAHVRFHMSLMWNGYLPINFLTHLHVIVWRSFSGWILNIKAWFSLKILYQSLTFTLFAMFHQAD